MPRLSGVEAVRKIRSMGGPLADVAIVVSSGRADMLDQFEEDLSIALFLPKGRDLSPLVDLAEGICAGTGVDGRGPPTCAAAFR